MASLQPKLLNTLSALSHPRKGRFCDLGGFGVKPPTLTSPFSCGICGLCGSSPGCARVSVGVHCVLRTRALQGLCLASPGMASPCTRCQAGGWRGLFTLLPLSPYSWAEFLTLAPSGDRIPVELLQILTQYAICRLPALQGSVELPASFEFNLSSPTGS